MNKLGEVNNVALIVRQLLLALDPNPNRSGIAETPQRVAKAWEFWTSGYGQDPASVLKVFDDGGEKYDEMVMIKNIPFYSHCEHHMAPFFGKATIAYIPNSKAQRIIGLSKASRLVEIFARRLQVQERLTVQIADALEENIEPLGLAVKLHDVRHLCMESRGVCQCGITTTTSALRGILKTESDARAEFFKLAEA